MSTLLVKLLRSRGRSSNRLVKQCTKLSLLLKDFSKHNGRYTHLHCHHTLSAYTIFSELCEELTFSLSPPVTPSDYQLVSSSVKLHKASHETLSSCVYAVCILCMCCVYAGYLLCMLCVYAVVKCLESYLKTTNRNT